MRVISQNEVIDVPYEHASFVITGIDEKTIDIFAYYGDRTYKMARYSSMERAKDVLRKLRYCGKSDVYYFPQNSNGKGDVVFVDAKSL